MVQPMDKTRKASRKRRAEPAPVTHSQLLACIVQAAGGHVSLKREFVESIPEGIGIMVVDEADEVVLKLAKLEADSEILRPNKNIIV